MEGISIIKLLVVGILIVLLFGISKLCMLGVDLGVVLKGFKKVMGNDDVFLVNMVVEFKVVIEVKLFIEYKD